MDTKKIFDHEQFLAENLKQYIFNDTENSSKEIDKPDYLNPPTLCPEPLTFLKCFDDISGDKGACSDLFIRMNKNFPKSPLTNPKFPVWFNTTKSGINLRPGIHNVTSNPSAVKMGDISVHGLMVGQTGSGKSVLLHNLIFNMLYEYAPWELDLYLADFKKLEFSRYMNKADWKTPHINACAATSEIRYVLSLIQYLVDCMSAREEFFSRLGIDKIATFREKFHTTLPRILLVVDEFQQMFLEASAKESEHIRQMLTAIVKKGRATGVHILFASQEMSQTLSRSDLANFRLRIALNCTPAVSLDILGNRQAATIPRGKVLINCGDGTEKENQEFKVPNIQVDANNDGIPYFDEYLSDLWQLAQSFKFKKAGKFYKEDEQKPLSDLENILDLIKNERSKIFQTEKKEYFEILTLGRYVTYSNKHYDIQTLYLSKGRNKNILAVSPNPQDLAYIQRLLALNFSTSPRKDITKTDYVHQLFSLQPALRNIYQLEDDLEINKIYTSPDDLAELEESFSDKRFLMQLLQECKKPLDFVISNYKKNLNELKKRRMFDQVKALEEEEVPQILQFFGNPQLEEIPELTKKIQETEKNERMIRLAQNLMKFYEYQKNEYSVFPPTVYWVSGIDSLERLPEWLLWMMKNGMDYNIMFVLMAGSDFDNLVQISKHCDYLFLGGNNRRIYERLNVNFTNRTSESIALDLYIKSDSEERSFKKYKCTMSEKLTSPSIDFDAILGK